MIGAEETGASVADVVVEVVPEGAGASPQVLALLYAVLYRDFGVAPDVAWYGPEPAARLALAHSPGGRLLGAARLLPDAGDGRRQLRQVAVEPAVHGTGVGRALVCALERAAALEGATEVWLHARESAFPFYERLGYEYTSELFRSELTGIPHRTMRKAL